MTPCYCYLAKEKRPWISCFVKLSKLSICKPLVVYNSRYFSWKVIKVFAWILTKKISAKRFIAWDLLTNLDQPIKKVSDNNVLTNLSCNNILSTCFSTPLQ